MNIELKIRECFDEALEASDAHLENELNNDSILLETGLDSLGFAILVALLEEELGFDPFSSMEEAFYPQTFGEFLDIYKSHGTKNEDS